MKKGLRICLLIAAFGLILFSYSAVQAQCSVCSANVASSVKDGKHTADGLNHGIMYLMAAPYLVVGILAYVWYKKYRRKDVDLNMRDERLHLN